MGMLRCGSPINFCTRQSEWLTSRPAPFIPSQRQAGALSFHRPVVYFLLLQCYINRQTRPYSCNILILYSALLHVSAVHIPHHPVSPNKQRCKTVIKYWQPLLGTKAVTIYRLYQ